MTAVFVYTGADKGVALWPTSPQVVLIIDHDRGEAPNKK